MSRAVDQNGWLLDEDEAPLSLAAIEELRCEGVGAAQKLGEAALRATREAQRYRVWLTKLRGTLQARAFVNGGAVALLCQEIKQEVDALLEGEDVG